MSLPAYDRPLPQREKKGSSGKEEGKMSEAEILRGSPRTRVLPARPDRGDQGARGAAAKAGAAGPLRRPRGTGAADPRQFGTCSQLGRKTVCTEVLPDIRTARLACINRQVRVWFLIAKRRMSA
jgi:hypothetical protein